MSGLVFSLSAGVIHTYYTVALAPAIGALVAIGAAIVWSRRETYRTPVAALAIGAVDRRLGDVLLERTPSWEPWLRPLIRSPARWACSVCSSLPFPGVSAGRVRRRRGGARRPGRDGRPDRLRGRHDHRHPQRLDRFGRSRERSRRRRGAGAPGAGGGTTPAAPPNGGGTAASAPSGAPGASGASSTTRPSSSAGASSGLHPPAATRPEPRQTAAGARAPTRAPRS